MIYLLMVDTHTLRSAKDADSPIRDLALSGAFRKLTLKCPDAPGPVYAIKVSTPALPTRIRGSACFVAECRDDAFVVTKYMALSFGNLDAADVTAEAKSRPWVTVTM